MQKFPQQALAFEDFTLNLTQACLFRGTEEIRLRPKSFEVLRFLVENCGRLVTKDELMQTVWPQTAVTDDSLVQCLVEIRKALGDNDQRLVKTVPRRGYIFQAEVNDVFMSNGDTNQSVASLPKVVVTEERSKQEFTGWIRGHKKVAAALLIVAGVATFGLVFGAYQVAGIGKSAKTPRPLKLTRLTTHGKAANSTISPDGRYVAYVYEDSGKQSILLRQVATSLSREMVAPFDGYCLALTFTPDGNFLYYVKGARGSGHRILYQVGLLGGESRQLLDDIDSAVTFSPDGKQFAFLRQYIDVAEEVLFVANADGTGEQRITSRKRPNFSNMEDPAWSPDGQRIAFIIFTADEQGYFANVDEINLATKAERKVSSDRWRALNSLAWRSDGTSVIVTGKDEASTPASPLQLWSINYADGQARRLTTDVNNYINVRPAGDSHTQIAVLQSTNANVWTGNSNDPLRLKQITSTNQSGHQLSWTSENKILFTSTESDNRDLWVMKPDGTEVRQLTFGPSSETRPVVTADNRYAVHISNVSGSWSVWRMDLDGKNEVELSKRQNVDEVSSMTASADGKWIFYTTNLGGARGLQKTSIDGSQTVKITEKPGLSSPTVSPDGKLIAYFFREPATGGTLGIQILSLENGTPVKQLKVSQGARLLRWSPETKGLTYVETLQGVSNVWSIALDDTPPRQLTNWDWGYILDFQWSRNGKQLAITRADATSDLVLIEESE